MNSGQTTSVRIYNAIKEACLSFSGSTKQMRVSQFRLWNNQVQGLIEGNKAPLRFPFVGIEFENSFNELSLGRQEIDGIFVLHLALQSLDHSDEEILTFKDELYAHLAYRLPKVGFMDFYRSFEVQDSNHTNVLVWQMEFSYSFIDDSAADEKKYKRIHPFDVGFNVNYE